MLLISDTHFKILSMRKKNKGKTSAKKVKLVQKVSKMRIRTPQFFENLKQPVSLKLKKPRQGFVWAIGLAVMVSGLTLLAITAGSGGSAPNSSGSANTPTLSLRTDGDDITVNAVGDILLARYIEVKMRQLKDYTYPFHKIADFLKNADITFGNLETPLMPGRNVPKDSMTFRGDPAGTVGLLFAGFDVLSIANNHTMNYQIPGLTSTLVELKKAGILASGGGKNIDIAHTPVILEAKGRSIAFYSYVDPNIPPRRHGDATADTPGIALMNIEAVKNDVKNALETADIVIISMHAGREYTREPTQFQKDFAHAAIDAGAAVVIGSHPHWVQPVEEYQGADIFYSLGNFVFDQMWSEKTREGVAARISLSKDGVESYELNPVKIYEYGQPRWEN